MKHLPRKRFGQHFLIDPQVLQALLRAIAPQPDDLMVEIGPGTAALTTVLLPALKHLQVVELDRDLVAQLKRRFAGQPLTIHAADALDFNFAALAQIHSMHHFAPQAQTSARATLPAMPAMLASPKLPKLRIVGNLPYNISTPLLFHLSTQIEWVQDQHFMLQKEVVQRMVAAPGSKTYGRLSVMLQWQYEMEEVFSVAPAAFDPPPKVESAVVRMTPRNPPLAIDRHALDKVVSAAFNQRRKVLRNALSAICSEAQMRALGINPLARAEQLSVQDFVALSEYAL